QRAIAAEVQRQVEARYHDIIGIIQHEFRTPMTLLLGYGEYLRDALDDKLDKDELKLSVDAILSGSLRLNRLIESFLFLSELQYKRADQLQMQRIVPAMLWREVQIMRRAEAAESPVEIVLTNPEDMPAAEVDPELVREALSRLLDNALQYTRPGSQEIRLRVETTGQWVRWIIEDQGPGIEADQLQRILEPFGHVQGKRFAPQAVGLSLAIVKRIAELHGGALTVESELDEGSRFILQLPRHMAQEKGGADDWAGEARTPDASPREDDEPPPKNGTYSA
ncbi:MAG: HAMP domain-containing sensor histidine kinase, partial [Litorilinea sp.]